MRERRWRRFALAGLVALAVAGDASAERTPSEEIVEAVRAGRYAEVETRLDEWTKARARTKGGADRVGHAMYALRSGAAGDAALVQSIERWAATRSGSWAARSALGQLQLGRREAARDDDTRVRLLDEAARLFEASRAAGPEAIHPLVGLLEVAIAELDGEAIGTLAAELEQRDPAHWYAHAHLFYMLRPENGGSGTAQLEYARRVVAANPKDAVLPVLVARAHASIADAEEGWPEYLRRPEVWGEIRAIWESHLAAYPDDRYGTSEFAWHAWSAGDRPTAKRLFDRIGDPPELRPWNGHEALYRHAQAFAEGREEAPPLAAPPARPLMRLFVEDRFAELDEAFWRRERTGLRTHDGDPAVEDALRWVPGGLLGLRDREAKIEAWAKAHPKSPWPFVVRARLVVWNAERALRKKEMTRWDAPAEELARYREEIRRADAALVVAHERAPELALPIALRIDTQSQLGAKREELEALLTEARRRDPTSRTANRLFMEWLMRPYEGSFEDAGRFIAREIALHSEDPTLAVLLRQVFDRLANDRGGWRPLFQGTPKAWQRMRAAYTAMLQAYPYSWRAWAEHAYYAYAAGDAAEARRAFAQLGPLTPASFAEWKDDAERERAREWAFAAPSPAPPAAPRP